MPHGWVVEAITREACTTLILHEKYNVAIEDASLALSAVEQRTRSSYDVRLEVRGALSERAIATLGLKPGEVRRQ